MTSSPGVAPGGTSTGSGNLGSNDGAERQKTRKSDEGRPLGAPRPSTGALCIFSRRTDKQKISGWDASSCAARTATAEGGSKRREYNTEGPRERARHHRGLALALSGSQGLRLGAFDSA